MNPCCFCWFHRLFGYFCSIVIYQMFKNCYWYARSFCICCYLLSGHDISELLDNVCTSSKVRRILWASAEETVVHFEKMDYMKSSWMITSEFLPVLTLPSSTQIQPGYECKVSKRSEKLEHMHVCYMQQMNRLQRWRKPQI